MPLKQIAFDFDIPAEPLPPKVTQPSIAIKKAEPIIVVDITAPKKSVRGRMALKDMNAKIDLVDVPADDVLFEKSYYNIGIVAKMFNVNQSLIRFWENEFDILKPKKNGKGDRLFRPEDVKNLQLIYGLLRERKFTLEGAKEFLKKNKKVEEKFLATESLKRVKGFLLELRANL
jgi:DNA-binding transcriptional MerR regulator